MNKLMKILSFLFLLLVCRPAQSQTTSGDEKALILYRSMADALLGAKTVQLTTKCQIKAIGFEAESTNSLLMKEGNKMRMEVTIKGTKEKEPFTHTMCMVSDGTSIRLRDNQDSWSVYATTKNWNQSILTNIIRGGFPAGLELDRIKPKKGNPEDVLGISFFPVPEPQDFILWKKDELQQRDVIPIEFKLRSTSTYFKENSVILWLDAGTGLPAKRMNVIQSDRTLTVTESYDRILLNQPVEESTFGRPKD